MVDPCTMSKYNRTSPSKHLVDPDVELRIEYSALRSGDCLQCALCGVLSMYCSLFSVKGEGVVLCLQCAV